MKKILITALLSVFGTMSAMAASASVSVPVVAPAESMSAPASNEPSPASYKQQYFYGGFILGGGRTDWDTMVATDWLTIGSNPSKADGLGVLYGVNGGYQFNPYFAIEGEYIVLPNTSILISNSGIAPINNEPASYKGVTSMTTHSWVAAVLLKIMAPIPTTSYSFYVGFGPGYQYRADSIENIGTLEPVFATGFSSRWSEHWKGDLAFQYGPGTGKSVSDPMVAYIPEFYIITFGVNYIF